MAVEWPETPLSDLTEPDAPVTYGVVKPGSEDPNGVLFVRGGDISNGRILVDQLRTISRPISNQYKRTQLRGGEIVMSLVGNPGQVALVPESLRGANIARQAALIRLRNSVDSRFVMYYLGSQLGQVALGAHSRGSVQQVINLRDLKTVVIPTPPLTEQRAIAGILGTLDDKIELNQRMNETLEALARILFKSWFVDFDPVRAKAEGRDSGLAQPLADLFPDCLEDSALGEIPTGWGTHPVGDLLSLDKGLSYKGHFLTEHGAPMINLGCFLGGGRFAEKAIKRYSGEYKPRHVVRPLDLVLANTDITQQREVIGSPALIPPRGDLNELIFSHHVFAARFHQGKEFWKAFVYFMLLQDDFRARAAGFATGTTVLALPRDAVLNVRFPGAPRRLVTAFAEMAMPMLERAWKNIDDSDTLATLRDALLPKLISGELRVKNAERIAARAI